MKMAVTRLFQTLVCLLLIVKLSLATLDPLYHSGQKYHGSWSKPSHGGHGPYDGPTPPPPARHPPTLHPELFGSLYKPGRTPHRPSVSAAGVHSRRKTAGSLSQRTTFRPAGGFSSSGSRVHSPGAKCDDPPVACRHGEYRTADGSCNNLHGHPAWGRAGQPQARMLPPLYQDGRGAPRTRGLRGQPLPSAREVSQALHTGDNRYTESPYLTHLFTMWGQFLDHDITHTPVARDNDGSSLDCCNQPMMYPERDLYWMPAHHNRTHGEHAGANHNPNCFPISINPRTDRHFTTSCMNFVRSRVFAPSRSCRSATREQGNTQTPFIDGSQVYGPSRGDQNHMRSGRDGQLKNGPYDLLTANSTTMCTKRPNTRDFCFGSGDPRVNEHPMLSSIHTVFHRLHNLLASRLAVINRHWNDEKLFQETRKIVGAILQHVTYAEYLPLVLGERDMARYNLTLHAPHVYDPYVNPTMINAFSTAAFRFGHSMINAKNTYGYQKVDLRDMFFHPYFVQRGEGAGLTLVLNGLVRDYSQSSDRHMARDVTDHLFQTREGRSLDLASLNIQRGRDHGLPPYDQFRRRCGLPSLREAVDRGQFADTPFLSVYRDLADVDIFTGGLAERREGRGVVGPTFACIIGRQFHRLKHGDRFWYQHTGHAGAFTHDQIHAIERVGLSDVLCATTAMRAVQTSPFVEPSLENPVRDCSSYPPMDLRAWQHSP